MKKAKLSAAVFGWWILFLCAAGADEPETLIFNAAAGTWDADEGARIWRNSAGEEKAFRNGSPVVFDGTTSTDYDVTVGDGVAPGFFRDRAVGNFSLSGKKLHGNAQVLKEGPGTLEVNGGGFDCQPILVTNGILRIGANAEAYDALGGASAPLEISGAGTLDIHFAGKNKDEGRSKITYCKDIQIEGSGFNGMGALVNRGSDCIQALHTIRLSGDATVSGPGRWDLRTSAWRPGRSCLNGPSNAVLTVRNASLVGLVDADVSLGKIVIRNASVWPSLDTRFTLGEGIELSDDGEILLYQLKRPLSAPAIRVTGDATIGAYDNNVSDVAAPVRVDEGASLTLSRDGAVRYLGRFSSRGTVTVAGGTQELCGECDLPEIIHEGGNLHIGGGTVSGNIFPKRILANSSGRLCFCPATNTVYSGMMISGDGTLYPNFVDTGADSWSVFEDVDIDVKNMRFASLTSSSYTELGRGAELHVREDLRTGETMGSSDKEARIVMRDGSHLEVARALIIGRWSTGSTMTHALIMEGGVLDSTNAICVGHDCHHARLIQNGGELNAGGIAIHPNNEMWASAAIPQMDGVYALNGGILNLGAGGFVTAMGYPRIPQVYLNGGTLRGRDGWATDRYQHILFDPYNGNARGTSIIDTASGVVSFRTALQGRSDVVLKGDGSFLAESNVQGGLSGHWTVCNRGETALANASAFAGGLTVSNGVGVTVDIERPDRYVSLGVFGEGNAKMLNAFCEGDDAPGWFIGKMGGLLLQETGYPCTAYAFEGDFEVTDPGAYTFGCCYDDQLTFTVDGATVCRNAGSGETDMKTVDLSPGWHRFKVTAVNTAGYAGPFGEWKEAGIALGWVKGARLDAAPSELTPFDTDSFRMRPAASVWHARSPHPESAACAEDWFERDVFAEVRLSPTLQMIHSVQWADGSNAVNELRGWIRVGEDQAGLWQFSCNYGGRIGLSIDGETVFRNDEGNEGSVHLTRGFHPFSLRLHHFGGAATVQQGESAISFRINNGESLAFDERNVRIVSAPYGIIGGELELQDGSLLVNQAETPCEITGVLSGTGTLKGKYRLNGATWLVSCGSRDRKVAGVTFDRPVADALKGLSQIVVAFDAKPGRVTYEVSPAMGLENLPQEDLQAITVSALVPGMPEPYAGLFPRIIDGKLFLVNASAEGTVSIIR